MVCHFVLQNREKAWFASSVRSRLQYLGPQPGVPIIDEEQVKDVHLDPSAVPAEAFCLLVLDPEKVGQQFCYTMCLLNLWTSAVFTVFMQFIGLKFGFGY